VRSGVGSVECACVCMCVMNVENGEKGSNVVTAAYRQKDCPPQHSSHSSVCCTFPGGVGHY